jgi:glutamyl-Q tRNA(Asp) synthetase
LVTAVGSFLQARAHHGEWLVRMEDLDLARNQLGAADDILFTLDALGLHWDGAVLYQTSRREAYANILQTLTEQTFICGCSRKELQQNQGIYTGTCRNGLPNGKTPRAIRLKVPDQTLAFHDLIQGNFKQHLSTEVGDFVIKRADGLFAYQFAVVIDDAMQNITEVVRGCDLLDSTPRQIYLQRCLKYPTPTYAHLPILTNSAGQKLSKQTFAKPVDKHNPLPALFQVLLYLGQTPPIDLFHEKVETLLQWAISNWQLSKVPRLFAQFE